MSKFIYQFCYFFKLLPTVQDYIGNNFFSCMRKTYEEALKIFKLHNAENFVDNEYNCMTILKIRVNHIYKFKYNIHKDYKVLNEKNMNGNTLPKLVAYTNGYNSGFIDKNENKNISCAKLNTKNLEMRLYKHVYKNEYMYVVFEKNQIYNIMEKISQNYIKIK